jgi:hypothetical protein
MLVDYATTKICTNCYYVLEIFAVAVNVDSSVNSNIAIINVKSTI